MSTTTHASIQHAALAAVERSSIVIADAYRAATVRLDVTAIALDRAIADESSAPTLATAVRLEAALTSWADAVIAMDALGLSVAE